MTLCQFAKQALHERKAPAIQISAVGQGMPEITLTVAEIPNGGCRLLQVSERLKIAVFRVDDRIAVEL